MASTCLQAAAASVKGCATGFHTFDKLCSQRGQKFDIKRIAWSQCAATLEPNLTEVAHVAGQLCLGIVLFHGSAIDAHIFGSCSRKGL